MISSLAPPSRISEVKAETLSALQADVAEDALDPRAIEPPELHIETVDDFELCRAVRNKGQFTGEFQVLDPTKMLLEVGLGAWEALFLQPRDKNTGELLPITYTLPSMYDEDGDGQDPPATTASRSDEALEAVNGNDRKRKTPPEDQDGQDDQGIEVEIIA